jgi:hypothetical protein
MKEARRGRRRYPPTISKWDGFQQLVEAFQPEHRALDRPILFTVRFAGSYDAAAPQTPLSDEKDEEGFMRTVLSKLVLAGLLGPVTRRAGV